MLKDIAENFVNKLITQRYNAIFFLWTDINLKIKLPGERKTRYKFSFCLHIYEYLYHITQIFLIFLLYCFHIFILIQYHCVTVFKNIILHPFLNSNKDGVNIQENGYFEYILSRKYFRAQVLITKI